MKHGDRFGTQDLRHLQAFICLVPVLGFFPALWTLYRRRGSQEQRTASRLAVLLAMGWLFGSILLQAGARSSDTLMLPLLITSSLLTSGYFLVNLWLMVQLWQRQRLWLPGLSGWLESSQRRDRR